MTKPTQEVNKKPFDRMLFVTGLSMIGGVVTTILVMTLIPGTRLQVVVSDAANPITLWDLFSYAGILITILAFLAAFFILFMAFDAFAVSKAIGKNKETLRANKAIIADHKQELAVISSEFEELRLENVKQQRMVSLNGLLIRELSSFQKEFSLLDTKVDILAAQASIDEKFAALAKSLGGPKTRQARLDALGYLAKGYGLFSEQTEDGLVSSILELRDSVMRNTFDSEAEDDATILLLLHQYGLTELNLETLTRVNRLVDVEILKDRGLLT